MTGDSVEHNELNSIWRQTQQSSNQSYSSKCGVQMMKAW